MHTYACTHPYIFTNRLLWIFSVDHVPRIEDITNSSANLARPDSGSGWISHNDVSNATVSLVMTRFYYVSKGDTPYTSQIIFLSIYKSHSGAAQLIQDLVFFLKWRNTWAQLRTIPLLESVVACIIALSELFELVFLCTHCVTKSVKKNQKTKPIGKPSDGIHNGLAPHRHRFYRISRFFEWLGPL